MFGAKPSGSFTQDREGKKLFPKAFPGQYDNLQMLSLLPIARKDLPREDKENAPEMFAAHPGQSAKGLKGQSAKGFSIERVSCLVLETDLWRESSTVYHFHVL